MKPVWLLALAFGVLAAACGSGETADTLAPEPDEVLTAAADAMGSIDFVRFRIERGGAPVYIDPLETLGFSTAEGQFAGPSSANAVVTLGIVLDKETGSGVNAQIGAVAIDGTTWLTNPITGDWEDAPEGYAFDPAILFDPERGWRPLLATGLSDVKWIGETERNGEPRYHIRAAADENRVAVILAGLIAKQPVDLDMWIDPATGYVREAELSTVYEGQTSDWFIEFTEFGEPVDISPPDTQG